MTVTERSPQAADLLRSLLDAPAESLPTVLRRLDAEFRNTPVAGVRATATELGRDAVPGLLAALADTPADRLPHLVQLLGLLADSDAHDEVRAGLAQALALFKRARKDRRMVGSLLFLAGLFPEDAVRVLAAARTLKLSADDRSRLERSLAEPPKATPGPARARPSAAMRAVAEEEHDFDHRRRLGPSTPAGRGPHAVVLNDVA